MILQRTVSCRRYVEVGRTPRLGSWTCLVIPKKAAVAAETSTVNKIKVCNLMNLCNLLATVGLLQ